MKIAINVANSAVRDVTEAVHNHYSSTIVCAFTDEDNLTPYAIAKGALAFDCEGIISYDWRVIAEAQRQGLKTFQVLGGKLYTL